MESHKFVIRFDRTFDFVPMEDASSTERRRDDHPEGCISTEERRDDEQRETTTTTQRRKRGGRTRGRSSLVCLSSTCGYHREEAGCSSSLHPLQSPASDYASSHCQDVFFGSSRRRAGCCCWVCWKCEGTST